MNKLHANTVGMLSIAFFAFLMLQVWGVDIIDDLVEEELAAGIMQDITIANFIMFVISLALAGALALGTILVLKTPRSLIALGFAIGIALVLIAAIGAIGLYGYPGFQLGPDTIVLLNVIFMSFVLKNPATWLFMFAVIIVISQYLINRWWKIE